jgi:integrase-like protein
MKRSSTPCRYAQTSSVRPANSVPVADRQPLIKPTRPNDVWSADFVFDRTAEGRVLKCLAIVDDATTEAVAIVPARALGGLAVTRVLDRLALTRGLPRVLRTDNGLSQKSRTQSFADLACCQSTIETNDGHPDGFRCIQRGALTIVTEGRGSSPRPARASYSVAIQAEGPRIIYEVVEDASTARGEGIRPPGLVASGKRR